MSYGKGRNLSVIWEFSKKILDNIKIKHVDVVYFIAIIGLGNIGYFLFWILLWIFGYLFEYSFENYLNNLKFYTYIFICSMIFVSVYAYNKALVRKIEIKNIDSIPKYKYIRILDIYRFSLLIFSSSTFILFVYFSIRFDIIFLYLAIILYMSIPILVLILFIKLPLFYTLNSANNIFNDYIYEGKKDYYTINKFNKYFKKSIDKIDDDLPYALKIDNLSHKDNISIKNTIKYYLPSYIKYGSQSQIVSLKNNIDRMVKCIDNDDKGESLDITIPIFNIFENIKKFIEFNNYSIVKLNRYIYLVSWIEIIKLLMLLIILIVIIKPEILLPLYNILCIKNIVSLFDSTALTNLLYIIIITIGYILIPIILKRHNK